MVGLLDVRQPVVGLDDREMAIIINALRHRRADYAGMVTLCAKMGCAEERERWQAGIEELDLIRAKLGDTMDEGETSCETNQP